ncbi:MAG: hypothetical protein IAF94_17920 [Pirellulaceae bacterium]|nr:hypothetical protein [Pirellulaceae bacterium]
MSENLLDNLDVFYGELTPARATVYARLEGLENASGLSLAGFVRGPRCFYSTTLLSTYPLSDAGPGPSLLAKALVPDPCYWSPETPNIYDVTVELCRGNDIIASDVRQIGFKPLGISGRFFTWEGKPWVLRGVTKQSTTEEDFALWRAQCAVLCQRPLAGIEVEMCRASEQGVLCFCSLPLQDLFGEDRVVNYLRKLVRFPAVAIIVSQRPLHKKLQRTAPNLLFVQEEMDEFDASTLLLGKAERADALQTVNLPVIIHRSLSHPLEIAEARAACDKLQADLAPYGQFAGYIV